MQVAGSEAQDSSVSATDLSAYNEEQLVQYLKRNNRDGGFDISSLVGVKELSESQRDELAQKLSGAASGLEFDAEELLTRLTNLAKQDGPPDLAPSPPPTESTESTPPPLSVQALEASSHDELIEVGGRPACSIQGLSHILAEPMTRYKAVLSWLSDAPDSEVGAGEIKTVFSRQFTRWWNFRKSQWDNRELGDSEEGLSAFFEASRRRYEGMGAKAMVSAPSFEETIRRQWQQMPPSRQLPDDQAFSAYRDAVKIRLMPHHFTRGLRLKKNPHRQDAWTNWLEYLNYEEWCLELLTATAESLEQQHQESWRRLRKAMESNSKNASGSSLTSGSTQARHRPGAKSVNLAKELEAAQADRDASSKTICDFIRETEAYTRAQTAAYYQRHRVEWVIKEARLMETEISQRRKTANSLTKGDANESKKRRRGDDDDDEILPEPESKRTKREDSHENATLGATPDKSHARRITRQSNRQSTRQSTRRSTRHSAKQGLPKDP